MCTPMTRTQRMCCSAKLSRMQREGMRALLALLQLHGIEVLAYKRCVSPRSRQRGHNSDPSISCICRIHEPCRYTKESPVNPTLVNSELVLGCLWHMELLSWLDQETIFCGNFRAHMPEMLICGSQQTEVNDHSVMAASRLCSLRMPCTPAHTQLQISTTLFVELSLPSSHTVQNRQGCPECRREDEQACMHDPHQHADKDARFASRQRTQACSLGPATKRSPHSHRSGIEHLRCIIRVLLSRYSYLGPQLSCTYRRLAERVLGPGSQHRQLESICFVVLLQLSVPAPLMRSSRPRHLRCASFCRIEPAYVLKGSAGSTRPRSIIVWLILAWL